MKIVRCPKCKWGRINKFDICVMCGRLYTNIDKKKYNKKR